MKTTTGPARPAGRSAHSGTHGRPRIGRTAFRLALVIMLICLAAVGTVIAIAGATVDSDIQQLRENEGVHLARALSLAAAAAHTTAGWDVEDLNPVVDLAKKAGFGARIYDNSGRVIRSSPGYGQARASVVRRIPVVDEGKRVGSVTIKFDGHGLGADINRYNTLRWHIRIAAAVAAVLVGVTVSLLVSTTLTLPVDRLLRAVRAMGAGDSSVRVGGVTGVPEIRELSAAFDQMADSISAEAQSRRDMAADLAHELRAPIAVLQAGLEAVQDGLAEPNEENLGLLRDEVLRLAQMADDLRVLSSGSGAELKIELATHDLASLAADAANTLTSAFQAKDITLNLRLSRVDVTADERRIQQVVVNLLGNAVKFTPAGGSVTLETGPAPGARFAVLRVSDSGIGIPASDLPFVTQRFFRGQSTAEIAGSGIGLAIVDQLVRLHHGHLEIASEIGRGTQVTVFLPRLEA